MTTPSEPNSNEHSATMPIDCRISPEQSRWLIQAIASVRPDPLDCDDCYAHMAEFVETELSGQPVSEALRRVEHHLTQCPCCADEHAALVTAMKSL